MYLNKILNRVSLSSIFFLELNIGLCYLLPSVIACIQHFYMLGEQQLVGRACQKWR